jgi:putative polyketide hydroxylase
MVRTAAGLLPEVEVKLRPHIPGTDLKVLGFSIGAQVARGSTVPAGRGCFP